jgi:hypothetical protein
MTADSAHPGIQEPKEMVDLLDDLAIQDHLALKVTMGLRE